MSATPCNASPWRALALLVLTTSASPCVHADQYPERSDWFGSAVAYGDFNGDHYADLAVGAYGEVLYGDYDLAGAVDVIYGSSAGLTASGYQFWHRDVDGVEGSSAVFQSFGSALAAGDFNGDHYDDLAIGVPGDNDDKGAVNVIYGSSTGLNVRTVPDQLWHEDSPNVPNDAAPGDRFGDSLAAGDFNDDGFADLAVGVPAEDVGSAMDAGAVDVIYGAAAGLSAPAPGTGFPAQHWHQNKADVAETAEPYDVFGSVLAVGDFNSDSYDDLAIGVWLESVGTVADAGAVHVIHGSATGLSATTVPDQLWHQNSSGVNDVAEATDGFGYSLAAGDFNGDTHADLAIGVMGEDIASAENGAVNVLYGSSTGLSATAIPDQFLYESNDGYSVIGDGASEPYDWFGFALAAGDFDGDGHTDLSMGTPGEDLNGNSVGTVAVLYGTDSGLDAFEGGSQLWSQDASLIEDISEFSDWFGEVLAAGDCNGDGRADLAVGSPLEDLGADPWDAGAANLIYGSAGGLSAHLVTPDQFWTQGGGVQQ
jgi:hypothetical protein